MNQILDEGWSLSWDMTGNPDFATWQQDIYTGLLGDTSPGLLFPHTGAEPEALDSNLSDDTADNFERTPLLEQSLSSTSRPPGTITIASARVHITDGTNHDGNAEEVPSHILAQHYSLTAVHRQDSKSWNFYMHFYNRFATRHPPVLMAIYAFASAQLFYAKNLGSMKSALTHYEGSVSQLSSLHGILIPDVLSAPKQLLFEQSLEKLNTEGLDVVIISLYFLALFDLLTTRPDHLRKILHVVPALLRCRDVTELSGTFRRLSTWFLYLDARASLFGLGEEDCITYTIGNEPELVDAVHASRDVLREEYSMLYPDEEHERDEIALPFLIRVLKLMAIFREISRHNALADESTRIRIREMIDVQKKVRQSLYLCHVPIS